MDSKGDLGDTVVKIFPGMDYRQALAAGGDKEPVPHDFDGPLTEDQFRMPESAGWPKGYEEHSDEVGGAISTYVVLDRVQTESMVNLLKVYASLVPDADVPFMSTGGTSYSLLDIIREAENGDRTGTSALHTWFSMYNRQLDKREKAEIARIDDVLRYKSPEGQQIYLQGYKDKGKFSVPLLGEAKIGDDLRTAEANRVTHMMFDLSLGAGGQVLDYLVQKADELDMGPEFKEELEQVYSHKAKTFDRKIMVG